MENIPHFWRGYKKPPCSHLCVHGVVLFNNTPRSRSSQVIDKGPVQERTQGLQVETRGRIAGRRGFLEAGESFCLEDRARGWDPLRIYDVVFVKGE